MADAHEALDRGDAEAAREAAERARAIRALVGRAVAAARGGRARGRASPAGARPAPSREPPRIRGSWETWLALAFATQRRRARGSAGAVRALDPLAPELDALRRTLERVISALVARGRDPIPCWMLRREGDSVERRTPKRLGITVTVALGAIVAFAAIGGTGLAGSLAKPVKAQYAPGPVRESGEGHPLSQAEGHDPGLDSGVAGARGARRHGRVVCGRRRGGCEGARPQRPRRRCRREGAAKAEKASQGRTRPAQTRPRPATARRRARASKRETAPGRCARRRLRVSPRSSARGPRRLSGRRPSRRTPSA